jgi:hypothetical protein
MPARFADDAPAKIRRDRVVAIAKHVRLNDQIFADDALDRVSSAID